ncbi:glutamyl-tRNA(Gln) amidotransferase subunit A-like protein [Dinothrombium tinctorium]|uniref:Glutamyl-tRNA(Gln) amidotransferase subunit A, mitochondrial n=1 Tax=Dinothrombium tinctorium TaxID=1965070 RepID=A0A3S3P6Q2_9ACAR|nr:glutamyl-tRNA(Gln) amidotransferase subunit A-like protein [Dinothrombium tinctorium]RWS12558.1 glutamyl-tRNA(Gln) amidotransferase subunit A-like protein [Dinothrombium tinctorium]RWS13340.1 glutamyl-tRNA(Gln) amidotransferase subunit A-like protein [Dinothrombium tinctorium]RWS13351.1 glutamyl-tRNA(Gln) amidotransferase subunit A-like protein [Dinothrombium tinctorium]
MQHLLQSRIANIFALFSGKKLSSFDLCSLCLEKIAKLKHLNAFITVDEEAVRREAIAADSRRQKGTVAAQSFSSLFIFFVPFHFSGDSRSIVDGIPIAVKDNFCTKDLRTTCASKMLLNYFPPYNATVVHKLFDVSKAILVGKTNLDEFAMGSGSVDSVFGPVKNPWKSKLLSSEKSDANENSGDFHICGGSSGGSAVAVATGCCFAAIASDTGGSTRNPSARVGVVGFKPTYGIASRYGLIPLTHSMDVPGIITRYVEDVALVFKLFAGHDPLDSTTVTTQFDQELKKVNISDLTIGIPKEYDCEGLSPEIKDMWKDVSNQLSNMGAKVINVSLPHTRYSISCYSVINACEVASNFACYDGIEFGHRAKNAESSTEELFASSRYEGFNDVVKGRILAGNYFLLRDNYEVYYNQALKVRRLIAEDFYRVFNQVDFLITPVTLTEAPLYSEWIKKDNREQVAIQDYCTQPVNMAGVPAISIPCKLSRNGLPLSLQSKIFNFQNY